jgi:hypothetical protein
MRPSVHRLLLGLALLALPALVAAGCGDDKKSEGATTVTALTAGQWREQADAICADIDTRSNAVAEPSSPAEIAAYLEKILPLGQEQVSRLKALVPPAELQSIQSQAVANQEEAVRVVQGALDRIKGGEDPTKVISELTADVDRITAEGKRLAQEAGLTKCGQDETTGTTGTTTETTETAETTETTETTETPTIPTTGDAQVDRFLADVQKATGALTAFGNALSAASDPQDIKSKVSELRGKLGEFDAAIASMDGYTLDNSTVEGQRSRLVVSGPKVSDVLRKFVDAAASGDLGKITAVLPDVATALSDFGRAAQPQ